MDWHTGHTLSTVSSSFNGFSQDLIVSLNFIISSFFLLISSFIKLIFSLISSINFSVSSSSCEKLSTEFNISEENPYSVSFSLELEKKISISFRFFSMFLSNTFLSFSSWAILTSSFSILYLRSLSFLSFSSLSIYLLYPSF